MIVLHAGIKPGEYDKIATLGPDGSHRPQWVRKLPPINLEPRSQAEIEQLERLERLQALERAEIEALERKLFLERQQALELFPGRSAEHLGLSSGIGPADLAGSEVVLGFRSPSTSDPEECF